MDCQDHITESAERKKGQHLQREERGAIRHLKNAGYTNRAIAGAIGCSPTTVGNELKRGTPPRKSSKGRRPGYSARRGETVYKANRKRSRKPHRICHCTRFIRWIMEQVKEHKWSFYACVGYTSWERPQNERHNGLFRAFVPKGVSIETFSAEYILAAADELNGRPRKKLGYRTPEELFDEFLDSVYAAKGCGSIAQDGSQRLPS